MSSRNDTLSDPATDGAPRARPAVIRALPNALTLCRLGLAAAFPWLPAGWRLEAVLAAAATEYLDGQVARWLGIASDFGRILDPIADKCFMMAVMLTLLAEGTLAGWQVALISARDILVSAGALVVAAIHGPAALKNMPPAIAGKLATTAQLIFLTHAVAAGQPSLALLAPTAVLSVAAALDYYVRFWNR